jgi:hypothetical protein
VVQCEPAEAFNPELVGLWGLFAARRCEGQSVESHSSGTGTGLTRGIDRLQLPTKSRVQTDPGLKNWT